MVDVVTDIIINKPIEQVAAYAMNPDNAPEWYVNIKSVTWKTPKPLNIDSMVAFTANFLGRKLSYTYAVREFVPGKKLVMSTEQGPFPMETTYTFESIDASVTKMSLRNCGQPSGFSRLLSFMMVPAMRKANKKDLLQLKQILSNK